MPIPFQPSSTFGRIGVLPPRSSGGATQSTKPSRTERADAFRKRQQKLGKQRKERRAAYEAEQREKAMSRKFARAAKDAKQLPSSQYRAPTAVAVGSAVPPIVRQPEQTLLERRGVKTPVYNPPEAFMPSEEFGPPSYLSELGNTVYSAPVDPNYEPAAVSAQRYAAGDSAFAKRMAERDRDIASAFNRVGQNEARFGDIMDAYGQQMASLQPLSGLGNSPEAIRRIREAATRRAPRLALPLVDLLPRFR